MKKITAVILSVVLILSAVPSAGYANEAEFPVQTVKQEYILTADSSLKAISLPGYVEKITFADSELALIRVDGSVKMQEIRKDLAGSAENLKIQPNYIYEAEKINDPYYSLQWGLYSGSAAIRDVDFEKAYDFLKTEKESLSETVVAVMDTGIDFTHADLADSMWVNAGEIADNGRDDDGNGCADDVHGYDFINNRPLRAQDITREFDHGTHCAGTIAAVSGNGIGIAGVAGFTEKVSLMDVKVLKGKEGLGSTFALVQGIRYAEKNGADICNLSMGAYAGDKTLYSTIASSDMLFVCAAGNDWADLDETPIYPGCYEFDHVICIGNSTRNGWLENMSNYSENQVDIAAPGTGIFSTLSGNRYGNMTGTSMAAPFVSGTAALLRSYYGDITASQIRRLILDGAVKRDVLAGEVAKGRYLNLYRPLTYIRDTLEKDDKAPVLRASVKTLEGTYKQRLAVRASDNSGRAPDVRYVRGAQTKRFFRSGKGYRVALDSAGRGQKTMAVPSVYSIYAVDAAGNDSLIKVRCTADAVSGVELNYTKKTVKRGSGYTLKATLSGKGTGGRRLTWSSSDSKVASVNSRGRVAGKKKGTAVITVKTSNGLKDTCRIVVK